MISRTIDLDYTTTDETGFHSYELIIEVEDLSQDLDKSWSLFKIDRDGEAVECATSLDEIGDLELRRRVSECLDDALRELESLTCYCSECVWAELDGRHKYLKYEAKGA